MKQLITNKSKINIEDQTIKQNWINKPETLGDVSMIQILQILEKKITILNYEEKALINLAGKSNKDNSNYLNNENINIGTKLEIKREELEKLFIENNFLEEIIHYLNDNSNNKIKIACKKDVSLLILYNMCKCEASLYILTRHCEIISILILHINSFKQMRINIFYNL